MEPEKRKINLLPPSVIYTPKQKALLEVKKMILKAQEWEKRNAANEGKKE